MEKNPHQVDLAEPGKPPLVKPKRSRSLLIFGGLIVFVCVALALGLGLGLGLKKHGTTATASSSPTPSATSSGTPSQASETLPPWRRDTAEYNLDMSWDINAAPTTRIFNLTMTEIQAAPDGQLLCLDLCTINTNSQRCGSDLTRHEWAISGSPHPCQSRGSSLGQRDQPIDERNYCSLARPLSKWDELDGWDYRNYAVSNSPGN